MTLKFIDFDAIGEMFTRVVSHDSFIPQPIRHEIIVEKSVVFIWT